jgi:hypothetical protein
MHYQQLLQEEQLTLAATLHHVDELAVDPITKKLVTLQVGFDQH